MFGGYPNFKEAFSKQANEHFSNGWAWLCTDRVGELKILTTHDHESPLAQQLTPLLVLDLWEHAYYLQHENKRAEYVRAFWKVVNWAEVNARWNDFKSKGASHREWRFAS